MDRKDISNYKLTSSSHLKLKFAVHFFLRFQTNASSSPILHFCVQYSCKDRKSNEEKRKNRCNFLQFQNIKGPPSPITPIHAPFCLKIPRD